MKTLFPHICIFIGVLVFVGSPRGFEITRVSTKFDTKFNKHAEVKIEFSKRPLNFPVYFLPRPDRVVIDMPNTVLKTEMNQPKSNPFIWELLTSEKKMQGENNVRMEVLLKKTVSYSAFLMGNSIVVELDETERPGKTLSIYKAGSVPADQNTLKSVQILPFRKNIEIILDFTQSPSSASIYSLEGPDRICIDLDMVFIPDVFTEKIAFPPVTNISVTRREKETPSFTSLTINLEKTTTFDYRLEKKKIIITLAFTRNIRLARRRIMMLIGTGVVIAGGTATSLLQGGEKGKPEETDLGAPPDFPDY